MSAKAMGPLELAPDFRYCLAGSLLLHFCFVFLGRGFHFSSAVPSSIEIDLTNPIPGNGPARLGAPKKLVPNAPAVVPRPAEKVEPPKLREVPKPPQDYTLPGPQTKKVVPPPPATNVTPGGAPNGTGTSPLPGGSGQGADYGSPTGHGTGGSPSIVPPKLLNLDEVLKNLRRFYPEDERRAGHEGAVYAALHIGADGAVSSVDILRSAGSSFDAAAKRVAALMRFSPAVGPGGPVAVKIAQPIIFRLEGP